MHKRSFIAGLGIGIIVGVLLLQLFTIGEKSQEQLKSIEQQIHSTDTQNTNDNNSKLLQEQEEDNSIVAPVIDDEPEVPDVTPPEVTTPNVEQTNNLAQQEQLEIELNSPASNDSSSEAFVIRIKPFTTLTQAAELLQNNELITNKNEFVDFFVNEHDNIRAGYFLVDNNSSISDLHKIFTSTPLIESEIKQNIEVKQIKLIE